MIKDFDRGANSQRLARIFNEYGPNRIADRLDLVEKFNTIDELEKYLKDKNK